MRITSNNIGLRIRELREKKGISQEEAAAYLHMNRAQIIRYEQGKAYPTSDAIALLCVMLNVTPNELFGLQESPKAVLEAERDDEKREAMMGVLDFANEEYERITTRFSESGKNI